MPAAGARRIGVDELTAGRLQEELQGLAVLRRQDHVGEVVLVADDERDTLDLPGADEADRVQHDFGIADAGEDLQEVFLQQELVVPAECGAR